MYEYEHHTEKNLIFTEHNSMNNFQYAVVMTIPGNIDHVNTVKS